MLAIMSLAFYALVESTQDLLVITISIVVNFGIGVTLAAIKANTKNSFSPLELPLILPRSVLQVHQFCSCELGDCRF